MDKQKYNKFIGKWRNSLPFDSDDYLSEYEIKGNADSPIVEGKDLQDGEKFKISCVTFDGNELKFESLMPSTNRKGINRLRILDDDEIEVEFSFTVIEKLKRVYNK